MDYRYKMSVLRITLILFTSLLQVRCQTEQEFSPSVTASCQKGTMSIRVKTTSPFNGAIHVREKRKKTCMVLGTGNTDTILRINILDDSINSCGIRINEKTGHRSVPIAVRIHQTLELADDKFYVITCESGFINARNESSQVSLNFLDEGRKANELTYGRKYTLKADLSDSDARRYGLKVVSCSGFGGADNEVVELIDSRGCPRQDFISKFEFDRSTGSAEATLNEMFKFPNSNKVHIQCEMLMCRGRCVEYPCGPPNSLNNYPRSSAITDSNADQVVMASTTAFVLEPGERPANLETCSELIPDCSIHRWSWLLGLTITFGILFLIMLIVNIFLCTAMTCTCTKTEVIEKEPSEMDDYDPYKVGWVPSTGHQSQYGSRYSLNGGKLGYTSGASTINSTTRSLSSPSDHYAIVHSRPNSRYSQHSQTRIPPGDHQTKANGRGPGSMVSNGHYSQRI